MKDGLKDVGQLKNVISKVATLVAHVRRSCNANEVLDGCLKLQPANQTRWNSQLKMLRSLLRIPQDRLDQLDCPGKLTAYDTKLIGELCEILTPLETATDMVQGDRVVTSSLVIVCIRGLRAQLQRLHEVYSSKLVTSLQSSLERRLAPYEEMELFQLATTLDPRFKLDWCDERQGTEVKRLLTRLVTPQTSAQTSAAAGASSTDATDSPPTKRCRLLSFLAKPTSMPPADVEVSEYLSQPTLANDAYPLRFWKDNRLRYPSLSKLACKYLALPGSSAPVERHRLHPIKRQCSAGCGKGIIASSKAISCDGCDAWTHARCSVSVSVRQLVTIYEINDVTNVSLVSTGAYVERQLVATLIMSADGCLAKMKNILATMVANGRVDTSICDDVLQQFRSFMYEDVAANKREFQPSRQGSAHRIVPQVCLHL